MTPVTESRNPSHEMIIIDDKIVTSKVEKCSYDPQSRTWHVVYKSLPRGYVYPYRRVSLLKVQQQLDPRRYRIKYGEYTFSHVREICEFVHHGRPVWHIVFNNGTAHDYFRQDLQVEESSLQEQEAETVFHYFKEIARQNPLRAMDDTPLLFTQYENIRFINKTSAADIYLRPKQYQPAQHPRTTGIIYPFGSNGSQKKAVERALNNRISVIQGPPGTGKTQTILNILANIISRGETALVVSNNNSATGNIREKLQQYNLDFLAAQLGSATMKEQFIETQPSYPEVLKEWRDEEALGTEFTQALDKKLDLVTEFYKKRERLGELRQEERTLQLEQEHFLREISDRYTDYTPRRDCRSEQVMKLWQWVQDDVRRHGLIEQFLLRLRVGIKGLGIFGKQVKTLIKLPREQMIVALQTLYYHTRRNELKYEMEQLARKIDARNGEQLTREMQEMSLRRFKARLYKRYEGHLKQRPLFDALRMKFSPTEFLQEYPVILSTTFSSRTNFGELSNFDYVIMDEASQVSSDTALLALSCARNAVIVGDSMQLPNVVTREDQEKYREIARKFEVREGYDCASHSFLESLLRVIPDVEQTLLREHYRCHPKIIEFCNRKFYGGELIVMTQDKGEKEVLTAIRTVAGNHARQHMNQREIEVIRKEVLPYIEEDGQAGIITPYNRQVDELNRQFGENITAATVHKYQGRETDTVIMSMVDDQITPFADDAHLMNVAISRAKKRFCLVVSGNPQPAESNVSDLIGYIEYNNFTVRESKIHSIFDYLYQQYTARRVEFLQRHRQVSEYASENLTYALLEEVITSDKQLAHLGIICHQPLCLLLRDTSLLTDEERSYASRSWTHLDFLIYNRVSKQAVLAVETDGYQFHKESHPQAYRDAMKDTILEKYHLPLIRFSTTGCNEREILLQKFRTLGLL